ncbi:MAG: hypothetical protein ACOY9Y_15180 [Bacillota bacterium]
MHEALAGFGDRMRSLAVFYPVFNLQQARKYPEYDRVALGFGVLLFILESMLLGRSGCEHRDVGRFLRQVVEETYGHRLTEEEGLEMAYFFLDALRNDGHPFEFPFRDLETGVDAACKFTLVETASYEIHGKVLFRLSSEGLDLLFKTKEIYKELRITILQLLFRQQVEKGVFQEALRTVDNMLVQVRELHEDIRRLRQRILRNVGQITVADYVALVERVHEQFKREKETFFFLRGLLEETQKAYRQRSLTDNERQSFDLLVQVAGRLDLVINEHNSLFSRQLDLSSFLEEAMLESLAHTFRTRVNFEREFVDGVLANTPDLDVLRQILHPLWVCRKNKYFNVMKALDSQFVGMENEGMAEGQVGPDVTEMERQAERDRLLKEQRDARYRRYIETCFRPLWEREAYALKDALDLLAPEEYALLIGEAEFYPFLVQLHQMGVWPLVVEEEVAAKIIDSEGGNLPYLFVQYLRRHPELRDKKAVEVMASREELALANGYRVTNYRFRITELPAPPGAPAAQEV